jgi:hypothetical protein
MVQDIDLNIQKNELTTPYLKDALKTSTVSSLPEDLVERFGVLIGNTINNFNEYIQSNSKKNDDTTENDENKENSNKSIDNNDLSKKKDSNSFENFNSSYNKLLIDIRQAKQNQYFQFMNVFRKTNEDIIKLYKFVWKLLNIANNHNLQNENHWEKKDNYY